MFVLLICRQFGLGLSKARQVSLPTIPLCWNRASIMKFSPIWWKKISFNTCTICALECQWVPSNRKLSSKWNKTNADAISKIGKKHQGTLQFRTDAIYIQKCVKSFKQKSVLTIPVSVEIDRVLSWFVHILFLLLCADLLLGFLFSFP